MGKKIGSPLNLSRETKNNIERKRDKSITIKDRTKDLQFWTKYLEQNKEI